MRARLLSILVLTLFASACAIVQAAKPPSAPQKTAAIAGTWKWKQGEEMLDLRLKQDGAAITGYHSAIGQRGMKADEVAHGGEPSIKGELKGAIATVKFRSGYPDSNGGGTATLKLRGDFLYWQVVKSEGEHYLPKTARLSRAK